MALHFGGSASAFIGQRPGLASVSVLLRQSSRTNSELQPKHRLLLSGVIGVDG